MNSQKQHVEVHRKLMLRRQLLPFAADGAAYLPFCGDGDLAVELYRDRQIFAADLDPERIATFSRRLPDAKAVAADCDKWPFPKSAARFSVGDFDAYAYPYAAFREFMRRAQLQFPLVLFFTDGQPQNILRKRTGQLYLPGDGRELIFTTTNERRLAFNFYWSRTILPWFESFVGASHVTATRMYRRAASMIYWGAVINGTDAEVRRHETAGADRTSQ